MNDIEYQKYAAERIRKRKAKQKRLKRQRLVLLMLVFAIFVLCGMILGLHKNKLENLPPKYNVDADVPMINVAKAQLGSWNGEKFWSWYGFNEHVEWCACFVSWVENENGYIDDGKAPMFCSVPKGIAWFEEHDQFYKGGEVPSPGDVIFFDWDGDGSGDHVGLVSNVIGDYVFTIEGNSMDMCRHKRYMVKDDCILGYGHIEQ